MTTTARPLSEPARIAGPDEGISPEELAMAGRNHSLLLEALRYDVTPPGLHYVLVHYDVPQLDPADWSLSVNGHVDRELVLDLERLRSYPAVSAPVTLECAGNGRAHLQPRPVSQPWLEGAVGTAVWTGARLSDVLADAGPTDQAVDVVLTGADHGIERGVEQDYARGLPLAQALRPEILLAYEMNGAPLPPQHGFPVRVVVPGWYGMTSVKWLTSISVSDKPFEGFQNAVAYRFKADLDDVGEPVSTIAPRALMAPPGFPDFGSRRRIVEAGSVALSGRAWSGRAPITRVDVSPDGGSTWQDTVLEPALGRYAWARWSTRWQATPGDHELCVRATDATGESQPLEPPWNAAGVANNAVQRVFVHAR
ncbi:MAG: sulfite oxidase [Actinomycetota bacterium]|nr:sulfite oxidase [Actinomycetota bacterium]